MTLTAQLTQLRRSGQLFATMAGAIATLVCSGFFGWHSVVSGLISIAIVWFFFASAEAFYTMIFRQLNWAQLPLVLGSYVIRLLVLVLVWRMVDSAWIQPGDRVTVLAVVTVATYAWLGGLIYRYRRQRIRVYDEAGDTGRQI